MGDLDELKAEIESVLGEVPPFLAVAGDTPEIMESLWRQKHQNLIRNPLPALFKAMFLACLAKYHTTPYCLMVRGCALRGFGLNGREILAFLRMPVPGEKQVMAMFRSAAMRTIYEHEWPKQQSPLWHALLWAAIRVALRRDPKGVCRQRIERLLGAEQYQHVAMLCVVWQAMRAWADSHPELDPLQDGRVRTHREALAAEEPELVEFWNDHPRRVAKRQRQHRERRLVRELAELDRVRQEAADGEQRFRRVIEVSPFPKMVYAEDGQVLMVNHAWMELGGWDMKVCATVQSWFAKAQPEEIWDAVDAKELRDWPHVINEGEQVVLTRDGQRRAWEFSSASLGKLPDGRYAILRMAVDVTERKGLETALWENNRRMVNTLEAITDGFVALDRDMRFVYMNGRAEELLGKSREECLGSAYLEVFPEAADSPIVAEARRAISENQTRHIESPGIHGDRWYDVRFYPSENGLSAYFRDVTEQREVEQALAKNQRMFEQIGEHLGAMIWMISADGAHVHYVSKAVEKIWGIPMSQVPDRLRAEHWSSTVVEEDRAGLAQDIYLMTRGQVRTVYYRIIRDDGSVRQIRGTGFPMYDEKGVCTQLVGVAEDITELVEGRRYREDMAAMLAVAPIVIVAVDQDRRVTMWSRAAEEKFGWRAADMMGKTNPLIAAEHIEVVQGIWDALRRGKRDKRLVPCTKPSGEVLYASFTFWPLRGRDGALRGCMGIMDSSGTSA